MDKNIPYILKDYDNLIIVNPEPSWSEINIDGITFSRSIFKYFSDMADEKIIFKFIKNENGTVFFKRIDE